MADNFKQVLQDCNQTCKDLSDLLDNENQSLEARNINAVEKNIKAKKQLTIKLEKFVHVIKNNIQQIRSAQDSLRELNVFKKLIESYQKVLERNTMLLKAAYTATSTLLSGIQKKISKPTVKTYNAYGQMQEKTEAPTSLVNYSV
ncbi:MAG: flagellar protein FlgN [Proteobacteria bacterium]|nr:flagellar protein FlgN [Pseudomonadota bacterium]